MSLKFEKYMFNCPIHGRFEYQTLKGYKTNECIKCVDEAQKQKEKQLSRQMAFELYLNRLKTAGIAPRYLQAGFDNFISSTENMAKVCRSCQAFSDNFKAGVMSNLILFGNIGTGKTHLAAAIARRLIERNISVKMITFANMIRAIRELGRNGEKKQFSLINEFAHYQLLILDEFDTERIDESSYLWFKEIITRRYDNCNSTILISNLGREFFGQILDKQLSSRLGEKLLPLMFNWEDYRRGKSLSSEELKVKPKPTPLNDSYYY